MCSATAHPSGVHAALWQSLNILYTADAASARAAGLLGQGWLRTRAAQQSPMDMDAMAACAHRGHQHVHAHSHTHSHTHIGAGLHIYATCVNAMSCRKVMM